MIGCCIDEDKWQRKPLAEVVQNKGRHCTDVPCCLFLLAVFISEILLIIYADSKGADPQFLLHGYDYNGSLCKGGKNSLTAWVNLEADDKKEAYQIRVCVDKCSNTNDTFTDVYGILAPYPSSKFLSSWCLPKSKYIKHNINATFGGFSTSSATFDRAMSDLNVSKYLILISCFVSIIIAFTYIKFISYLARCLIVLSLILTFVGFGLLGYYLIAKGIKDTRNKETRKTALLWIRKRIATALQMLNEASRAVRDVTSTVIFPVIYSLVGMSFFALWTVIALYIFSVKIKKKKSMPNWYRDYGDTYIDYVFDTSMKNSIVYHFIALVYIMQVIIYFGFMVLAGTFADWYFSEWDIGHSKKKRGHEVAELSHAPICESTWRVFRYHLGSLAFGALLIVPIRILQAVLLYVSKKTEKASNSLTKCLAGCAGYIIAVKLIWQNVVRAAMVEGISHYMEIFGRITIAALTTGIAVLIMNTYNYYVNELSSILVPCIVIFCFAYLIGSLFMMVFEVAVDTIFLCYLVDEEANNGAKFAHDSLTQMAMMHRHSV